LRSYTYDQSKIEIVDMIEPYFHHISRLIDFDKIRDARLFPLIDSMSGAGQDLIQKFFMKMEFQLKQFFLFQMKISADVNLSQLQKI
jgi:phosphoglucomutase